MSKSILMESIVGTPALYQVPVKKLREQAYQAREFIFDDEASRHVADFIGNNERLIIESLQFAIPPFPVTYVQFNIDEAIQRLDTYHPGAAERRGDGEHLASEASAGHFNADPATRSRPLPEPLGGLHAQAQ